MLLYRILLLSPERVEKNLRRVQSLRKGEELPTLWQLSQGVLRMYHRLLTRPDTIGTSDAASARGTWRAQLLQWRPLRFPFLLWERAVAPWDMSGLISSPERIVRHLLAAHHDKNQFVYDIQLLSAYGYLGDLHARAKEQVDATNERAEWLRDLCVYEGYHRDLLKAVEGALEGDFGLLPSEAEDPDVSFYAYLNWCRQQPATPARSAQMLLSRIVSRVKVGP